MKKRRNRRANGFGLHRLAMSSALAQALEGWHLEWYHQWIEDDPEMQEFLRESGLKFYELLVRGLRKDIARKREAAGFRSTTAPAPRSARRSAR